MLRLYVIVAIDASVGEACIQFDVNESEYFLFQKLFLLH